MTNYVQDTLWEEFPVDFDTGLQELEELGILNYQKTGLSLQAKSKYRRIYYAERTAEPAESFL